MITWNVIGAIALGVFVGFVIRFFIERFEKFTAENITAVLTTALSGIVISFLADFGPNKFAGYLIGLVFGLIEEKTRFAILRTLRESASFEATTYRLARKH